MRGRWRVLPERVRGMEGDGGEVPRDGEAIRGKDTERGCAGILKFYADVHRTKKNSERYRI